MLTVKKLVDDGLITQSLADIVFTRDEHRQKELLSFRNTIRTSYRVCLLYTALLQAYVVGKAIKNDCSTDELGYPKLVEAIKKIWSSDESFSISGMSAFSMLFDCVSDKAAELSAASAYGILSKIRKQYEIMLNPNYRYDPTSVSFEDVEALLEALPLLSHTEFDNKEGKLVFLNVNKACDFEIMASPFLSFWDDTCDQYTTYMTDSFAVISSVRRGERNGALLFDIQLFTPRAPKAIVKTLRRQAEKNEGLQMICKVLDVPTDWYPVDDCFCDLTFLENLTDVTSEVMNIFWKKHDRAPSESIAPKLKRMFKGSEIYSKIDETRMVPKTDLNNIFYELFINFGMFKTIRALFLDTKEWPYGNELFLLYVDELIRAGFLSKGDRESCEAKCRSNIEAHLSKLKAIVSEKSMQYDLRSRMIYAEWQAFCVLSEMGLKADNLLTDEETIHSIDDYYDMLRNDQNRALEGLREVLMMLCGLYGSLLNTGVPFDEREFSRELAHKYQVNKDKKLEDLMADFQSIVEKSVDNPAVRQLMGRDRICNSATLSDYLGTISEALLIAEQEIEQFKCERKKIFISYSHRDASKAERFVKALRAKLGDRCDIFFDTQLRGGQDWERIAKREMGDNSCVAVIAFTSKNSIKSNAVAFELEHAEFIAKQRHNISEEFIIAVNLEDEPLDEYLFKTAHSAEEGASIASRILTVFHRNKIYRTLPEQMAELEADIDKLIEGSCDAVEIFNGREYNELELAIANFYAFLKLGDRHPNYLYNDRIDEAFSAAPSGRSCIFPLVASVKETKIKRDNITLAGYEIIGGKGETERGTNYILSSRTLGTDDYYCIPNRRTTGHGCSWMVEPLLISHSVFPTITEDNN